MWRWTKGADYKDQIVVCVFQVKLCVVPCACSFPVYGKLELPACV
jgi:hypothetical protein